MAKALTISMALLAALAFASPVRPQEERRGQAPKVGRAAASGSSEGDHSGDSGPVVDLAGGLSSSYVERVDGRLDFWVRAANHGTKPLTEMKLELLDRSGTYFLTKCWTGSPQTSAGILTSTSCAMKDIAPNEEETVGGALQTRDQADSENLAAVVEWGPTSSAWVNLGTVSSDIGLTYWLETHTVLISAFGALLLGVIAYFAKLSFDNKRAKSEAKRTQQAETWNELLTESTGISRKYYLPMWGALQAFLEEAEKHLNEPCPLAPPNPTAAPGVAAPVAGTAAVAPASAAPRDKVAFYYWCAFERRCLEIQRKISGFHFKNYTGELVVQRAYYKYRGLFYDTDVSQRTIVDNLLEDIALNRLILSDFLEELSGPRCEPSYDNAWKMFHGWMHTNNATEALKWLNAIDPLLGYETNRPYYYWYGWLEPVEISDDQITLLKTLGDSEEEKTEIAIYLDDTTKGRQRDAAPGWWKRWRTKKAS